MDRNQVKAAINQRLSDSTDDEGDNRTLSELRAALIAGERRTGTPGTTTSAHHDDPLGAEPATEPGTEV